MLRDKLFFYPSEKSFVMFKGLRSFGNCLKLALE